MMARTSEPQVILYKMGMIMAPAPHDFCDDQMREDIQSTLQTLKSYIIMGIPGIASNTLDHLHSTMKSQRMMSVDDK